MTRASRHPFVHRWNHNAHYYPLIARQVPADARVVLDVGCGEGTLARYLARPGRRVLGVDPDTAALATARAQGAAGTAGGTAAGAAGPGRDGAGSRGDVDLVAAGAEALPVADRSVDALTMVMVLHHTDPTRALAEVRRVLRPGGVAVILGYGRSRSLLDGVAEARDAATHRWYSRRMQAWEPDVVAADPTLTWAETRHLLRAELPGSRSRRLPMWRYLCTWRAP
ncbi:MAG TPA: class I SAM-dependent methyltransferase [Cellulomonas sp.]